MLNNGILTTNTRQDIALCAIAVRLHVTDERKLFVFTFMVSTLIIGAAFK